MSARLILGHKTWGQLIKIRFWCNYRANTDAQEKITCCEALCLFLCSSSPRSHSLFCCALSNFPSLFWLVVTALVIFYTLLELFASLMSEKRRKSVVTLTLQQRVEIFSLVDQQVLYHDSVNHLCFSIYARWRFNGTMFSDA